ncbi:sigma-54-dependent Fis family transcriptional regulator [Candidatus Fermentibacteria bacterium]|nr:sigma-54-dependent Fis family transcriptional regulator [Candidatus Fermentibacteria bacterium]
MSTQGARIAVVEDEPIQRRMMIESLEDGGYAAEGFGSAEELMEAMQHLRFDVVITDMRLPGVDGVELLRRSREIDPKLQVIVVTAYATVETAIQAVKGGAYGYLRKPVDLEELLVAVGQAAGNRRLREENMLLREQLRERYSMSGIIGNSPRMQEVFSLIVRAAPSSATVLVTGESGTGKELVARAMHLQSPRATKPFVAVNCAALPETLLEAELFGHEKGAFTGAERARVGRFEAAEGGSLFLDEIGDIPLGTQVKLLRFLQDHTFERVGSSRPTTADVRILAATNRNLEDLMKQGRFREDLYWRLNVVMVALPPLRERKEDLAALIEHFLARHAKANRKKVKGFSREFFSALYQYTFPGNVRELENVVERAVVLTRGDMLRVEDLPLYLRPGETPAVESEGRLRDVLQSVEQSMIRRALADAAFVQTKAAQRLGLSERMLRYKMRKYGLKEQREEGVGPQKTPRT